jgi:hypothetical protein
MKLTRSPFLVLLIVITALAAFASPALADGPAVSVSISSPANNSYSDSSPNLTFTSTGTQLLKICSVNGGGVNIVDEGCTSGWNPGPLPEGTFEYTIIVEKNGGEEIASDSRTVTIDKTAPVVSTGGTPAAGISSASTIKVNGSAVDANPSFFNCRIDENAWSNCVAGTPSSGGFDLVNVAEGTHTYSFRATDKAGNVGYASRIITLDRTAPVPSITDTGWGTDTKDNTPSFLLNVTDANPVARKCSIDGAVEVKDCPGSTFLVTEPIADGTYTARLTATDGAGNSATATHQFTLDATMPVITHGGFENDRTTSTLPEMEFWVTDEHGVEPRCGYDPAAWEALDGCGQGTGHLPSAPLSLGSHQFWISATDSFGNIASAIYTFEVVAPGQQVPGGEKPGGPGVENGGFGKSVPLLAVASKASNVKRGKFTLTSTITLTPAAGTASCDGSAVVRLTPKVKKAKAIKAKVKLSPKAGACKGIAKFKLAAKLKKKKAGITVNFGGNAAMAQFTSAPVTVKL